MSNTEMVSVPRELADRIKLELDEFHALDEVGTTGVDDELRTILAKTAEQLQVEPLVSIPEGYCIMPRRLTAENGAKALLLGEFKLEVTRECPECLELEKPSEGCEICDERVNTRNATPFRGTRSNISTARP
ncbi:hypothetical protein GIB23_20370 [Pseudomonas putida]|uniref:hypothetical protein n=1 Tax=Pseudomonas putida TaxID=303 RepID=UPI001A8C9D75|nr:hypothetical protein [Pseudomonas putida]MBO0369435.1 hypothetical protein [Pseudomonas putida]